MDSDEETLLLALLIRRRRRRRLLQRSFWMHPITSERLFVGQFYTLMEDLRADNAKFFNYFRMSQKSFNELAALLRQHIQKSDTNMRKSIPAEERLAITLRYLASGCLLKDLHYTFRCGTSTAQEIILDVCSNIWRHLHDICFPELTTDEWLKIAAGFESKANFPNCLGAIDGKHIKLVQPSGSGSLYFNYKKYFSMVLLAVCDSNYRFIFIDTGSYGKASDSSVYKNSILFDKIKENTLNIPNPKALVQDQDPLPYTFIGDEAFGLSNHMLRPYGGKNLSKAKKIFNYRLSRARRYIECSFGILTNKWRIFHRPINLKPENAEIIIKACCALHNFVRERDGIDFECTLTIMGFHDDENFRNHNNPRNALTIREKFTDYFSSEEGAVPWQEKCV